MPRFYGDRLDIVIEDGQNIDDAMRITNTSVCSSEADFGFESLSQTDQDSVNDILTAINSEVDSSDIGDNE